MTLINTILCSCPNRETAEEIARQLVERRLAACVSILPGMTSIYRWQGKVETESEELLLIKTSQPSTDALQTALVQLHPYDVPEIIVIPIEDGHRPYFDWVDQCTTDDC